MSDVEERLRAALRAEADGRPVDVAALQQRVESRLPERVRTRRLPAGRGRVGRAALPLLAAAAAAAAVAGTVAVVDRVRPEDPVGARQVQAGVADRFVCPSRGRTVFGPGNTDDSFLPELTDDLHPAGEAAVFPRYEVEPLGGRVRVRFGDKDGTLASVVVFRRTRDGYQPVTVTKCTNGPGPRGPNADPDAPPPGSGGPGQLTAADFPSGSVKLFDSVTYDVNGLPLLRSLWAESCGKTVCLVAGKQDSSIRGRIPWRAEKPSDATNFLYDSDTIVGQRTGYRLVLYYDRDNSLVTVSWRAKGGGEGAGEPVSGSWGTLWAMVVPRDEFAGVKLYRVDGTEFIPARDIKG
jgi:hypothetical protein